MKRTLFALAFAAVGVIANAAVDMNHIDTISGLTSIVAPDAAPMQIFGDFPTFTSMTLEDFNASGTIVTNVSVAFETSVGAQLQNITGWQISIFSSPAAAVSSGANMSANTVAQTFIQGPGAPATLPGTGTTFGPAFRIDFNGLNMNLGATGHYWIGVAAQLNFTGNGQLFILNNTTPALLGAGTNNDSVFVNPGGGFGLGTTHQNTASNAAYMVQTQPVPEPASIAALGLGALALLRRRRKNA